MRRRNQSGYALLLVFLMAAVVALTLYMEIPRIAFETQRQREELLIERGHEYQRAIQVFVSAKGVGRYPASIDELESLNNRRYLRHRYVDPMTGKDDWRLIHIQNGVLTDSVTTKQKGKDQASADSTAGQYVGEHPGLGQDPVQQAGSPAVNVGQRRRASDNQPIPPQPGSNSQAGQATDAYGNPLPQGYPTQGNPTGAPVPGFPGAIPGFPGQTLPGGMPGQVIQGGMPGAQSGQTSSGIFAVGGGSATGAQAGQAPSGAQSDGSGYVGGGYSMGAQPVQSNQPPAGGMQAGMPGQMNPGQFGNQPGIPGAPGSPAQPVGSNPQMPGVNSPSSGFQPGQLNPDAQNAAAIAINNMLRSPRPTGAPGTSSPGMGGQTIGGGIAGIASKFDSGSIMVYSDQTNYASWEFLYDPNKVRPVPNPLTGAGIPAAQMGNMSGQSSTGTSANQMGGMQQNTSQPITSFGQGQGQGSFGQSSFGQGQQR